MTLEDMLKDRAQLQRELAMARQSVMRAEGALMYLDAKVAAAQKEAEKPAEPEPPKEASDGGT